MPIKNLSDVRRLPRLGKIALGVKKDTKKDGTPCAPYPTEVDYFVVPDKVQEVFGEKPKELRIMFPVNSAEVFFEQWYKCYGASMILKCKGDGERANTWDEEKGGMKGIPCPCPKLESGDCKQIGILQFMMPDVDGVGVWQITTSSKNSIINLNSSIDFIRAICGRVNMIPLILKREEQIMTRTEGGKPKKSTHYPMKLDLDENVTMRQLQEAAQIKPEVVLLPPPDESKDDLFYPANGFKDEEKDEKAELEKAEFARLGGEFEALLKKYQDLGGKIGPRQQNWIAALKTVDDMNQAIEFFAKKKEALESKAQAKKPEDQDNPF